MKYIFPALLLIISLLACNQPATNNPQPILLPRPSFLNLLKRVLIRQQVKSEGHITDAIASLASQRCAGYTTRLPMPKERDY